MDEMLNKVIDELFGPSLKKPASQKSWITITIWTLEKEVGELNTEYKNK